MAKDYVVRFTGEDNLSQTLSKVKNELKEFGSNAAQIDTVTSKVEQINRALDNSNYKRAQKEIENTLITLERMGKGSSATALHLRELGASIVDMVGDARQELRLMSSDTANFDAAIEGFNLIASTVSIATGAMALFGGENEEVTKAIAKVQGAMGILQGVQSVSNMLNKDSILMLQLKSKWEAIKTAATVKDTIATAANNIAEATSKVASKASAVATGVDTAATVIHSATTKKDTIATQAWNITKAISKALLGDFTGLLIVGAGALATYAVVSNNASDEEDKNADSLLKLKSVAEQASDSFRTHLTKETANLIPKYLSLRDAWNECKTVHEKNQFIIDNATEFKNLGLNIKNVSSAESAFNGHTNDIIKALNARAEAAAYAAVQMELYEKAIRAELQVKNINKDLTQKNRTINNQRARAVGNTTYHDTKNYKSTGAYVQGLEQSAKESRKQAEEMGKKAATKNKEASTYEKKSGVFVDRSNTKNTKSTPKKKTPKKKEPKKDDFETGSIADYQNQIAKLDEQLTKLNLTEEKRNELMADREVLQKKVDTLKGNKEKESEKPKYELGSIGDLRKQSSDIEDQLKNLNLSLPVRLTLITKKAAIEKQIDELENPLQAQIEAEQRRAKEREELQQKQIEGYQAIGQSAAAMGQIMSAAGADGVGAVMQMVAATAEGVSQMIPQIMALIGAKEGEALASGTASAAALPFPANIVGIAAIVATVLGTFASISSVIGSFANGGIISTGTAHGDMALARVNSGEMILNGSQQKNLFNLLNNGGAVGGAGLGGNVVFEISGKSLRGVLKNYDSKMSKIK